MVAPWVQVIMEIISSIRRLERKSHRSNVAQRETSIELGLFDGSLGARVSGQSLGAWHGGSKALKQWLNHDVVLSRK